MKFYSTIERLEFVAPFEISKLVRSYQDVLRVELHTEELVGYGETPAIPYYGKEVKKMSSAFIKAIPKLCAVDWSHSKNWYPSLLEIFPNESFLRSAIDAAAWDLLGKQNETLVWKMLSLEDPLKSQPSNYTIGIGTAEYVVQQIIENPWPSYKLKLGSEKDKEVLRAVAKATSSQLRLDANGAWTAEETKAFLDFCTAELPEDFVELVEEPFQSLSLEGIPTIKASSSIPFFADESFQSFSDLEKIGIAYHGVNIKLDKCGGLTPAIEIISKAKELGLKIQLGCMSSSGIALAPAIQISSLADVVDLDAAVLVKDADFGVNYIDGVASMTGNLGLGIAK